MVVAQRSDGQILVTKRGDDAHWCLLAGAAELGGTFAKTAVAELAEEVGLTVEPEDLVPFGTLSDAAEHTIHYQTVTSPTASRSCASREPGRGSPPSTAMKP